jgi:hypothetical protein
VPLLALGGKDKLDVSGNTVLSSLSLGRVFKWREQIRINLKI